MVATVDRRVRIPENVMGMDPLVIEVVGFVCYLVLAYAVALLLFIP
jgi:hypothetical protein